MALAIIHIPLIYLAKALPKANKVQRKVSLYLYWNGTIRFFMEGYMDFAFYALMNLKQMDWSHNFVAVSFSNCLAIFFAALVVGIPILFVFFYARNRPKWIEPEF